MGEAFVAGRPSSADLPGAGRIRGPAGDGSFDEERDPLLTPLAQVEGSTRHPAVVEPVEVDLVTIIVLDVDPC